MKKYDQSSARIWLVSASFGLFLGPAHAAIFTVNDKTDPAGTSTCIAPVACSLRQAIAAANLTTAADTIKFAFATIGPVSMDAPNAPEVLPTTVVIQPTSALPIITQPLTIDGYSAAGSALNTDANISNARIRIHLNGTNAGNNANGLFVCANNVTIRGLAITNFDNPGINFGGFSSCTTNLTAVSAVGNFIGLTPAGAAAPNNNGIRAENASVTIGTAALADRNVISSNTGSGISLLSAASSNSSVLNNLIGTDPTGLLDRGNAARGVDIGAGAANVIVGTAGAPNKIAFNNLGVAVRDTLNNRLNFNQYGPNDALGIDLLTAAFALGVSPNDAGDADGGGNGQQNYLNDGNFAATRTSSGINITGTLQRIATTTQVFTITAYATASCDASGHGEGETLLGSATESTTSANAAINVNITLAEQPPFGSFVTTTVTAPGGSTSEFSVCDALDPAALVVNTTTDTNDGVCNAAHCSLREAIIAANVSPLGDTIQFAINPAVTTGELLILPTTPLPTITAPVLIDGYSQSGTSVNTDPNVSNAVLRIGIAGTVAGANASGLSVCANDVTIQGLSITNFAQKGIRIGTQSNSVLCPSVVTSGNVVGNFLGLAIDGVSAAGNAEDGINVNRSTIAIGSINAKDRNVISSNGVTGIKFINARPATAIVLGNLIGTDKNGVLNRGNGAAVELGIGVDKIVLGSSAAPNLMRFNTRGITTLSTAASENSWIHNRIFDSANIGIDLNTDGVTPNDLNDADTGPNGLQNFPVITRAERTANGIVIGGTLDVPAGSGATDYTIGVYANGACDASGFGEGERLLGAATLSLRGINEDFVFALDTTDALEAGVQITSTATGPEGSSEFSACVPATDPVPGIVVDSRRDQGLTALGCEVFGDSNECTLREAIALANSNADVSLIRFDIAGTGTAANGAHDLVLSSLLPVISAPLTLDGYLSQAGASANTAATGSNADIKIQLNGNNVVANLIRTCSTGTVEIRGLALVRASGAAISSNAIILGSCPITRLLVHGNFIGVDPGLNGTGFANLNGITIDRAVASIGSNALADRNVIANNSNHGVAITGQTANAGSIQNNEFGLGSSLFNSLENGVADIALNDVSNITIGGEGTALNRFRQSPNAIVVTGTSASGNRLYANSFFRHSGATAIDLSITQAANGIDLNDVNDVDVGANELQNSPVLSDGSVTASGITINGVLDVPSTITTPANFLLAFYESTTCSDSAGLNSGREGSVYLGAQTVAFAGNAENFSVALALPPSNAGSFITATATAPNGSTSEFSNCLAEPVVDAIFADGFEN
jgi:CSLREA domain-containing protein